MAHSDPLVGHQDAKNIELVAQPCFTVPIDPDSRGAAEFALFSWVYCLDRGTEIHTAAGFDLDERDGIVFSDDQVDIAMPGSESMGQNPPSRLAQPSRGYSFPQEPEGLSLACHGHHNTATSQRSITNSLLSPHFSRTAADSP